MIRSLLVLVALPAVAVGAPPDFAKDVAPLLERYCVRCHQPGNAKGDVSLAGPGDLLDGGHVVPGKPGESDLLGLLIPKKPGMRPRMPKEGKPLTEMEVGVLREWIAAGAAWPKEVVPKERAKADKFWWSLQPLAKADPPSPPGSPPNVGRESHRPLRLREARGKGAETVAARRSAHADSSGDVRPHGLAADPGGSRGVREGSV